ncbi:hypothetical protein EUGRSUZ_H02273 [Eucalyptus grandis]|uniref:Uncharacterized protein n=2 Tax=Eucalyptus grandis TaxID=71139 RepID=A0A059B0W9_EUCGR|nr:hypothetical protein EUGRSUZ_H02273 [Eucalyptus grandis]
MEKQEAHHQEGKRGQAEEGRKQPSLEGLPIKDSPYMQSKDLEDYKLQGYGAQGHLEPKPGRGAGTTDAPTMPGSAVSSEAELAPAEAAHRQGVLN